MTRESAIRTRALLALALVLTGCNPPLVYNPQQPIAPNINDRSAPDLELRVYYDATRFDSVVKPAVLPIELDEHPRHYTCVCSPTRTFDMPNSSPFEAPTPSNP